MISARRGGCRRPEQGRRQFGQALALRRLRRAIAAEMPGADDAADVARPPKPRLCSVSSASTVDVAGEDQIADPDDSSGRGLEQRGVMLLDRVQEARKSAEKPAASAQLSRRAAPSPPRRPAAYVCRRRSSERVSDTLQEPVLPGQHVARVCRDPVMPEAPRHRHSPAAAQLREATAGDKLRRTKN